EDGHSQGQVRPGGVGETERGKARAEGHRDSLRAGGEAAPPAGHDQQDLGERDGGQREVRAPQPVRQVTDDQASAQRQDDADEHAQPGRAPEPCRQQGGRVGADAEEGGVAQRDLAGIAPRDVPGRRDGAPQQYQDQTIEEELIVDDERHEGGDAEEGQSASPSPERTAHYTPSVSAPRWPNSPAGRKTSTAMKRTK